MIITVTFHLISAEKEQKIEENEQKLKRRPQDLCETLHPLS